MTTSKIIVENQDSQFLIGREEISINYLNYSIILIICIEHLIDSSINNFEILRKFSNMFENMQLCERMMSCNFSLDELNMLSEVFHKERKNTKLCLM